MDSPIELSDWALSLDGLVQNALKLTLADIRFLPKIEMANTL